MLLTNTFERITVFFLVHELTSTGISLDPALGNWVENLRAITHGTAASVVTDRWIFGPFRQDQINADSIARNSVVASRILDESGWK